MSLNYKKNSKYSFSSDKLTLTISNTQITDIGLYRIVVSDDISHSATNITLKDIYSECIKVFLIHKSTSMHVIFS